LLNYKKAQDVEFFRTQVDSLAAGVDRSFLKTHAQLRSLDFGKRLFRTGASQRRSNARQRFSDCERFYNVIVRPRIQRDNLVMFRVFFLSGYSLIKYGLWSEFLCQPGAFPWD
jgi:hypothetical protein